MGACITTGRDAVRRPPRLTPRDTIPGAAPAAPPASSGHLFHSQPRLLGGAQEGAVDRDAREGITRQQQGAVEVDEVGEAGELQAGRDAEARADLAAEQYLVAATARG